MFEIDLLIIYNIMFQCLVDNCAYTGSKSLI